MIELRIGGQAVDIAPNTKITLNFNSNVFGDISKIQPSNSLTISLPKTPTNSKVFGVPAVVGISIAPYRRWNAELYVNGVSVVDTAYAVLLSVGDSYEIALYWGVVTALSTLKDSGKTLADINEVLEIKYGGENWWQAWEGRYGNTLAGVGNRGLLNAVYEAGIEDLRNNATARAQVALLPSVRASWLWDNIVADNGLNVSKPSTFTQILSKLALPFASHKTLGGESFSANYLKSNTRYNKQWEAGAISFHSLDSVPTSVYFEVVNAVVPIWVSLREVEFDVGIFRSKAEGKVRFAIKVVGQRDNTSIPTLHIEHRNTDNLAIKKKGTTLATAFSTELSLEVEIKEGEYIVPYIEWIDTTGRNNPDGVRVTSASVDIVAQYGDVEDQVMGGMINTRDNLPDISQLDFVKAMCAMYGLWATLIDGVVHLVSCAGFYRQTAIDWSHKLVGTGDGDAANTTYTLADYAQRNILRYKEDDTVKVDASGVLVVDNENLDREKDMAQMPFAASDGNTIPHLKWKDDNSTTGEVEEVDVEQRIMVLTEKFSIYESGTASLSFDGLQFSQLIPEYYNTWQKIMRNPFVIEEKVQLSEIDIKTLDFRKPIYLQKYGAQFVVDKVQWSEGEPSTVTLVKLPPAKDIGVALPYKVTTGVTLGLPMSGAVVEPNPAWAYLVSGAGDYFAEKATLRFDEATANAKHSIGFVAWTTEAGRVLSTDNPFVYDGSNGDMVIYANTADTLS
ncbi:MAG: hypothetical protein E7141_04895 [Rikenellaceae bacterium]|nr:hypothetical protein [Rikenellaceae bacterium]